MRWRYVFPLAALVLILLGCGEDKPSTPDTPEPSEDTTPPVITAVSSSNITTTMAAITWTTNEASDSQGEYGRTTTYGIFSPLDTTLVTSHLLSLGGLRANTVYNYRVRSRDAAGNLAVSGNFTFTTTADTTPPPQPLNLRLGGSLVPDFWHSSLILAWGVRLTWDAPIDTAGPEIRKFHLYRCCSLGCDPRETFGEWIGDVPKDVTTFFQWVSRHPPSDTMMCSYEVVSQDWAGRLSESSNRLIVAIPPAPEFVIDEPANGDTVGYPATFRWHWENPIPGMEFTYQVRLDKGVNACDDSIERAFDAGEATCITLRLDPSWWDTYVVLAVRYTDVSSGQSRCLRGGVFWVRANAPPGKPCAQ